MKSFITEVLGIDGRGLRLMRDVFWNPKAVFADMVNPKEARYSAPLRVWLWLYGVNVLTLLLTGGMGGMFQRMDEAQQSGGNPGLLEALSEAGVDTQRFLDLAGNWWAALHYLAVLLLSIIPAYFLSLFHRDLRFTQAANIYLSCLVAASMVAVAAQPFILTAAPTVSGWLLPVALLVVIVTFLRGGYAIDLYRTKLGGAAKALLVGLLYLTTVFAASMALFIAFVRLSL